MWCVSEQLFISLPQGSCGDIYGLPYMNNSPLRIRLWNIVHKSAIPLGKILYLQYLLWNLKAVSQLMLPTVHLIILPQIMCSVTGIYRRHVMQNILLTMVYHCSLIFLFFYFFNDDPSMSCLIWSFFLLLLQRSDLYFLDFVASLIDNRSTHNGLMGLVRPVQQLKPCLSWHHWLVV